LDPFIVKLALSLIVGGVWITLTTIAAETLGSKLGGLIGGLPSTIVVALFFIGWTQGLEQARAATTALPAALAVNAIFLVTYAALARQGLAIGIGWALAAWLTLQGALVLLGQIGFGWALIIWAVTLTSSYLLMTRTLDLHPHGGVKVRRSRVEIAGRGLFSGGIVAAAVILSRLGGPVLGAVMAVFPAVYLSTLVITARSVSVEFSRALTPSLMVSAIVNCAVYGTVFRFGVMNLGLVGASALAYGAAAISAYGTYRWLARRS